MRKPLLAVLALTAAAAAACDDVTGTRDGLAADEVTQIADAMIATGFAVTGDEGAAGGDPAGLQLAADSMTAHTEFTTIRSCRAGGQVVLEGTRDRLWDPDTRSGSSDLALTKTHEACARTVESTGVTITVDGAPNVAVAAHHAWADGQRSGLQSMSMDGAIDWATDDDRVGTCTIDLDVTFDPESRTRTVVGTFCNRTIDRTTTWHEHG